MELPKISIIVAVYNTESYLHKCIESIVNQTYQNLEIILVDDGSTDSSFTICSDFAKLDNRIKILQKSNGGQGSARNLALNQACGEWIGFVDSDDWIESDMYERLISKALSEHCEIVECGWNKVSIIGVVEFTTPSKEILLSREQAMHSLVYAKGDGVNTSVCNKIFKRYLITDIRFPEVRAYEDDEFVYKVIWKTQKIVKIGEAKYNYLTRPESTMNSCFNLNKLAVITVQDNICEFLKYNAPHYFNMAQRVLCSKYFYVLYLLKFDKLKNHYEVINEIENKLLSLSNEFNKNPLMGINRLMLFIFKYSPNISYLLFKLKFHFKR